MREHFKVWRTSWCPHDGAKSQLHKEGDWQAPFRDLANQGAVGAGVRLKSSHHKKAKQYARRSPGAFAGEIGKT